MPRNVTRRRVVAQAVEASGGRAKDAGDSGSHDTDLREPANNGKLQGAGFAAYSSAS